MLLRSQAATGNMSTDDCIKFNKGKEANMASASLLLVLLGSLLFGGRKELKIESSLSTVGSASILSNVGFKYSIKQNVLC